VVGVTYRAQGDGGGGQADEAAVAGVGLVHGIGIVVAQLMDDAGDAGVVVGGEGIADQALELERAALALVVELVVQRLGDVGVHGAASAEEPGGLYTAQRQASCMLWAGGGGGGAGGGM